MATDVETGHGSEVWLADGAGVLTKLGEITAAPIPSGEAPLIDASHMDSVEFRDYITAPLREGDDVDIPMNYVPGSDTDDLCKAAVGKRRAIEIRIPVNGGAQTATFATTVLVRRYNRDNPMLEKRAGMLRVKWVDAVVETIA